MSHIFTIFALDVAAPASSGVGVFLYISYLLFFLCSRCSRHEHVNKMNTMNACEHYDLDLMILKLILFGLRNLLTLQHIDVINELFDLEWGDTWVWENPSIFIILSV